ACRCGKHQGTAGAQERRLREESCRGGRPAAAPARAIATFMQRHALCGTGRKHTASTRASCFHSLCRIHPRAARMKKLIPVAIALVAASVVVPAHADTLVPSGNRSVDQPPMPGASSRRTQATSTTFQAKYRKIYALLKNDPALRGKIRQVSAAYGIDPIH